MPRRSASGGVTLRLIKGARWSQQYPLLLPDAVWALIVCALSVGVLLLRVLFGTPLFFVFGAMSVPSERIGAAIVLLVVQAIPVMWASRHPTICVAAVYAMMLAMVVLIGDRDTATTATVLFAVFALYAGRPAGAATAVLIAALLADIVLQIGTILAAGGAVTPILVAGLSAQALPVYAAPILAGLLFSSQRERLRIAGERAAALASVADARATEAVEKERQRMSGEVHDIAAHHLSSIILQTRAAEDMLATEPASAKETLTAAREEAETTLEDLRQLASSLRHGTEPRTTIAEPTLTELPALVASVRSLYPEIELTIAEDLPALDAVRSLACYRIVQESLSNARTHAPGAHVTVNLRPEGGWVAIEIVNTPAAHEPTRSVAGGGLGIPGMRERARTLGGSLESGPTGDGGWLVRATIPARTRWT